MREIGPWDCSNVQPHSQIFCPDRNLTLWHADTESPLKVYVRKLIWQKFFPVVQLVMDDLCGTYGAKIGPNLYSVRSWLHISLRHTDTCTLLHLTQLVLVWLLQWIGLLRVLPLHPSMENNNKNSEAAYPRLLSHSKNLLCLSESYYLSWQAGCSVWRRGKGGGQKVSSLSKLSYSTMKVYIIILVLPICPMIFSTNAYQMGLKIGKCCWRRWQINLHADGTLYCPIQEHHLTVLTSNQTIHILHKEVLTSVWIV